MEAALRGGLSFRSGLLFGIEAPEVANGGQCRHTGRAGFLVSARMSPFLLRGQGCGRPGPGLCVGANLAGQPALTPPGRIAMQKEAPKGISARTPVLTVKNISYYYGSKQALDDVSFEVFPGKVTALLGPNGAGKTTLFSLITRLFDAPSGRIEIVGRSAAEWGSKALGPLGVVFQQPTLDLDLSVKQNLRYFASLRGLRRKA